MILARYKHFLPFPEKTEIREKVLYQRGATHSG
jgi:hypothetical protein